MLMEKKPYRYGGGAVNILPKQSRTAVKEWPFVFWLIWDLRTPQENEKSSERERKRGEIKLRGSKRHCV
jgi:hypothetical protein